MEEGQYQVRVVTASIDGGVLNGWETSGVMSSGPLTTSLRETLALFIVSGEPWTTPEVAAQLDIGRRSTYERLARLVECDRLETKAVGASARVWWRPLSDLDEHEHARETHPRVPRHTEFESLVDTVTEYAIFTLDTDGCVQTWNAGARQIKGYAASEILGEQFSIFYTAADKAAGVPERNLSEAKATSSVEDEGWRVRADGSRFWANVTITAIRDADGAIEGYVKVTRDMTDQRETERALRSERNLLEQVQEASPIGIGVFDTDGELLRANHRFMELLGRGDVDSPDYQLGEQPILDAEGNEIPYPDRPAPRALSTGEPLTDQRIRLDGPDGRTRWLSANAKPFAGETNGVVVTMADITLLTEQTRRLERQRDELKDELEGIFERVDDGFYALATDRRFTYVNPRAADLLGSLAGELIGEHIWDAFEHSPEAEAAFRAAETTQQSVSFEVFYEPFETWYENHVHPSEDGLSVYFRDISERKQLERDLKTEKEHFRVALENSPLIAFRLDTDLRYTWVHDVHEDFSEADVLGKRDDELMSPEAAEIVMAPKRRALETGDRVREEVTYGLPSRTVTYDLSVEPFRDESGEIVGLTAAAVDITERKQHERDLKRQREQLAALNSLNEVVSGITDAVISQSTREEIEQTVCEHLAAADSYLFAWVGDTDTATKTVSLRAEAGVEGYLDDITISVDPDDERSEGPTGRAFRTGEIQTTRDLETDARYKPWQGQVESYGWRSSAAIPISHKGTIYGVLNVYADRPRAFEHKERHVIAQLGEVIGHAIAATERKQALMSDEVTELSFTVRSVLDTIGVDSSTEGRITFDHTVQTSTTDFLQYGTVETAALPTLEALVDQLDHFEGMRIVDHTAETARFELRLSAPPVISVVASHGGYVQQATIEDGDFQLTIHLPTTVTARRVIDAVREAYPTASLVRRRQITRSDETLTRVHRVVTEELTDRQRTALETAVHSGFFNWPRDATGEEIAATIGISAPTFHQHLRIAQRKLVESVFSVPAST
jgi:PAS domain S-box-containing protein